MRLLLSLTSLLLSVIRGGLQESHHPGFSPVCTRVASRVLQKWMLKQPCWRSMW